MTLPSSLSVMVPYVPTAVAEEPGVFDMTCAVPNPVSRSTWKLSPASSSTSSPPIEEVNTFPENSVPTSTLPVSSTAIGASLVPVMVTVTLSVTVSPSSSSAVTAYSRVMVSPSSRKSKSRPDASSCHVAVLSPLSVTEIAPSKAICMAIEGIETPDPVVTTDDAAPEIARSVSLSSAKIMVPLASKSCDEASTASLMPGSTAAASTVGGVLELIPLIVMVMTPISLSPLASCTV